MESIYQNIQSLLRSGLGTRLGLSADRITYRLEDDPGPPVPGHRTGGKRETINIPDEYMSRANAHNATEFLTWLQTQ